MLLAARSSDVVLRWFVVYALVELAAVAALAWAIGLGWTILLVLAALVAGIALAGSQARRQIRRLRGGLDTPQGVLSDSALIALGTVLVVVPGIVTTAAGLLLLLPPTRTAARPLLVHRRRDYIDGKVVDVVDVEPRALPR